MCSGPLRVIFPYLLAQAATPNPAIEAFGHPKGIGGWRLSSLSTFDFSRLRSEWGYRFLISGDEFVGAAVFLVYGVHFARLLGLPEQPRSKIPLLPQLPARYRPLFVEGCGDVLRDLAPIRLNGTIVHQRRFEFYRATFMPIGAAHSVRPLILGSFNYRSVPQEGALDGFRTPSHSFEGKLRHRPPETM